MRSGVGLWRNQGSQSSGSIIGVDRTGGTAIAHEPSFPATLWKYKITILVTIAIFAVAGYGLSLLQETLYEADGTLVLIDPRTAPKVSDAAGFSKDPKRHVANQAELITSPEVTGRASQILGGSPDPQEISNALTAEPVADRDALSLGATASVAADTVAILDAVVQAYGEKTTAHIQESVDPAIAALEVSRSNLEAKITELENEIAVANTAALTSQINSAIGELRTVNASIATLNAGVAAYGSGVQTYIAPKAPTEPFQPKPLRNAVLAAILGVVIGITIAWWRGENDLRTPDPAPRPAVDEPGS